MSATLRPGAHGKRRFRDCAKCGRGFYGPEGACSDCRSGARGTQLEFRSHVSQASEHGARKRRLVDLIEDEVLS